MTSCQIAGYVPTDKLAKLAAILQGYGSVLVAFSGGVDSSLLLKVAVDSLGDRVVAFTEASPLHQSWELAEARELAFSLGLPTWNRQPLACLASRFPYGTTITLEKLRQVEACETFLRAEGLTTFRVRYHDTIARIEVGSDDVRRLVDSPLRESLVAHFKAAGFTYVALDLDGFRSGSMNENL